MQYMAAVVVAQAKEVRDDGSIIEIVVGEQLLSDLESDVNEWS
jgi:hypothetical protein